MNQWPPLRSFSMTMMRSSRGVSENSGAAALPATIVKRALGISSSSRLISPDERTASPIRVAVMNRIGKAPCAIANL